MALPSVSEIETAHLHAWPALETAYDRSWVVRAAGGYSKRANCIQSLSPEDDEDAVTRIERARDWLAARDVPVVFRVTPLAGAGVSAALDQLAWETFEHTSTLIADPSGAQFDDNATLSAPVAAEWLEMQRTLQGYNAARVARLAAIVAHMDGNATGIVLRGGDGAPLASAWVNVAHNIGFIGNVVTAVAERGKGYGKRLIRSCFAAAANAGAEHVALQVLSSNVPAQALYAAAGFTHYYDYHHRKPPA